MLRDPLLHRGLEDGVLGGNGEAMHLLADLAGLRGDDEAPAATQQDEQGLGLDQSASALDDQVQHAGDVGLAADGAGDVDRGLGSSQRLLDLGLALAQGRIQAGVLDRDPGPDRQRLRRLFIVLVELHTPALLGHVEVAVGLVADRDRHPEEGVHRRVAGREAVGMGVLFDVAQPQRHRLANQLAEDPAATRQAADRAFGLVADAEVDEAFELGATGVEHAQCRVLGRGDLARRLHDRAENHLEVELGEDRRANVDQPPEALFGGLAMRPLGRIHF